MKRKHLIQFVVGVLLSGAALYWVLRDVSLASIVRSFRDFNYVWFLPGIAVFYLGVTLRGVRWAWLFRPKHSVSYQNATKGLYICFAFNSVFPARAGEFARAYLIARQEKTKFSTAMGTVVVERVLDSGCLLLMWIVAYIWAGSALVPKDAELTIRLFGDQTHTLSGDLFLANVEGIVYLSVLLVLFIGAISVERTRGWILRLMQWLPLVPQAFKDKVEEFLHQFAMGMQSLHHPGRLIGLVLFSIFIWFTAALSALFFSYGYDFANPMTLAQSLALVFIISVFIMVPAAPGYWGFYEAGCVFGVIIMGIHPDPAVVIGYAIMLHLTQWLPVVLIGLPLAWFSHVSLDTVEQQGVAASQD